uniref:K Homology domain-containing protein n=1 Tax=Meloidogyne javanica TaxID=6303 RepID=A0A915MNR0_MELJA
MAGSSGAAPDFSAYGATGGAVNEAYGYGQPAYGGAAALGYGYGTSAFGAAFPADMSSPLDAEIQIVLREIHGEVQLLEQSGEYGEQFKNARRLLATEATKLENNIDPEWLEVDINKPIKVTKKILVPSFRHQKFNFVGKVLGPKGTTLQNIAKTYKCHVYILGRGSTRDRAKEQELLAGGDPQYAHYGGPLHVKVETTAPPAVAYQRVAGITTEPNPTKQEDDGEGSGGDGGDGDKKNGADSPGGPRFSSTKYLRPTFSFIKLLPLSSIVPLTKIPKIMLHNGKVNLSELKSDGNTTINLYQQAVYQLNCLQSNTQIISAAINLKKRKNRQDVLEEMMECLTPLNISLTDIDSLNCIHIAGTKGKGSTCAFLESILRQLGYKTGFYSSPHLIHVRERIQINGQPINEELFAKHFFHVFNTLKDSLQNQEKMPGYFKFLTIMAFYIFYVEKVDVAIVEVGIGGENDCTNIIQNPVVCGITTLDLDHTSILGSTIPEIAWHKAGIAKPNCTLLTVEQPSEAIEVIKQRCKEINSKFLIVPSTINSYKWPNSNIKFGISGYHQHLNVSLALQLARIFCLNSTKNGHHFLPFFSQNLSKETTKLLNNNLDGFDVNENIYSALFNYGAHTPLSIKYCAQWFKENSFKSNNKIQRLLIFHCTGYRDSLQLLPVFKNFNFNAALFCPAIIEENNYLINDSINLNHDSSKELR